MEEAVEELTACPTRGADWPYALAWLYKGPHHTPLPKDGHLGILPQRGAEETPCGWISQLEVCQLLAAGPQIIFPVGLNGLDEPIITTLPELLASSVSLTASKYIYLRIDIPSPPVEELDQKISPLGKVSTLLIASPHKPSPKSEGSMTMEVSNLLSQAVLEASSCESEHSFPRRPTPAVVLMTPPQKPEGQIWPVDTSSQASIEEMEASLEGIHASISPIAAVSITGSISPPEHIMELWTSANKALHDLLTTKASIDAHQQRAMWELNIALHQSQSKAAASIKEAKAACSQATLNAHATCSWLTLEAKTNCSWAILEAKTTCSMAVKKATTTRGHMVQKAKATCSKSISELEAHRVLQAELLHREHGSIMWDLEGQVIEEENRS